MKVYEIGNITIEQHDEEGNDFAFKILIDGQRLSMCALTLDRALVVALSHKYGEGMHGAPYAMRVLGMCKIEE